MGENWTEVMSCVVRTQPRLALAMAMAMAMGQARRVLIGFFIDCALWSVASGIGNGSQVAAQKRPLPALHRLGDEHVSDTHLVV